MADGWNEPTVRSPRTAVAAPPAATTRRSTANDRDDGRKATRNTSASDGWADAGNGWDNAAPAARQNGKASSDAQNGWSDVNGVDNSGSLSARNSRGAPSSPPSGKNATQRPAASNASGDGWSDPGAMESAMPARSSVPARADTRSASASSMPARDSRNLSPSRVVRPMAPAAAATSTTNYSSPAPTVGSSTSYGSPAVRATGSPAVPAASSSGAAAGGSRPIASAADIQALLDRVNASRNSNTTANTTTASPAADISRRVYSGPQATGSPAGVAAIPSTAATMTSPVKQPIRMPGRAPPSRYGGLGDTENSAPQYGAAATRTGLPTEGASVAPRPAASASSALPYPAPVYGAPAVGTAFAPIPLGSSPPGTAVVGPASSAGSSAVLTFMALGRMLDAKCAPLLASGTPLGRAAVDLLNPVAAAARSVRQTGATPSQSCADNLDKLKSQFVSLYANAFPQTLAYTQPADAEVVSRHIVDCLAAAGEVANEARPYIDSEGRNSTNYVTKAQQLTAQIAAFLDAIIAVANGQTLVHGSPRRDGRDLSPPRGADYGAPRESSHPSMRVPALAVLAAQPMMPTMGLMGSAPGSDAARAPVNSTAYQPADERRGRESSKSPSPSPIPDKSRSMSPVSPRKSARTAGVHADPDSMREAYKHFGTTATQMEAAAQMMARSLQGYGSDMPSAKKLIKSLETAAAAAHTLAATHGESLKVLKPALELATDTERVVNAVLQIAAQQHANTKSEMQENARRLQELVNDYYSDCNGPYLHKPEDITVQAQHALRCRKLCACLAEITEEATTAVENTLQNTPRGSRGAGAPTNTSTGAEAPRQPSPTRSGLGPSDRERALIDAARAVAPPERANASNAARNAPAAAPAPAPASNLDDMSDTESSVRPSRQLSRQPSRGAGRLGGVPEAEAPRSHRDLADVNTDELVSAYGRLVEGATELSTKSRELKLRTAQLPAPPEGQIYVSDRLANALRDAAKALKTLAFTGGDPKQVKDLSDVIRSDVRGKLMKILYKLRRCRTLERRMRKDCDDYQTYLGQVTDSFLLTSAAYGEAPVDKYAIEAHAKDCGQLIKYLAAAAEHAFDCSAVVDRNKEPVEFSDTESEKERKRRKRAEDEARQQEEARRKKLAEDEAAAIKKKQDEENAKLREAKDVDYSKLVRSADAYVAMENKGIIGNDTIVRTSGDIVRAVRAMAATHKDPVALAPAAGAVRDTFLSQVRAIEAFAPANQWGGQQPGTVQLSPQLRDMVNQHVGAMNAAVSAFVTQAQIYMTTPLSKLTQAQHTVTVERLAAAWDNLLADVAWAEMYNRKLPDPVVGGKGCCVIA